MASLIKMRIEIDGSWVGHTDRRYSRWEGAITADHPVAALTLMKVNSQITWARSRRTGLNSLPISLLIGQHDEGAYVSFGVGDSGTSWRAQLHGIPQDLVIKREGETGKPLWLIELAGDPTISLGCFVVAHSQTKSARNKLWHLRPEVLTEEETWTVALSRGRTGQIAL